MDACETAVSFLAGTGGSVVQSLTESLSDMLLSKYLKNILLLNDELQSRTGVSVFVCMSVCVCVCVLVF